MIQKKKSFALRASRASLLYIVIVENGHAIIERARDHERNECTT